MNPNIEDRLKNIEDSIKGLTDALKETIDYVREEKEEEKKGRAAEEIIFIPIFNELRIRQLAERHGIEDYNKKYENLSFEERIKSELKAKLEMIKKGEYTFEFNKIIKEVIGANVPIPKAYWEILRYIGPYKLNENEIKVTFPFVFLLGPDIPITEITKYISRDTFKKIRMIGKYAKETGSIIPFIPTQAVVEQLVKAGY